MSNKETGGPVFPFNKRPERAFPSTFNSLDGKEQIHAWGMELRDYFAGQVVVGVMSEYWNSDRMRDPTFEDIALSAYGIADAMLKAREA